MREGKRYNLHRRPWYHILRTEENDDLFLDEEAEKEVEEADEGWLSDLRHRGGIREMG